MSTHDVTAPGRTALWTEAALRALTGAAFITTQNTGIGENDPPYTPEQARAIAIDAMAIATAFEAACIEQEVERAAAAAQYEADVATVKRVRRYRILWAEVPHVLTVARVGGKTVYFEAVADVANGAELHADIDDVVGGEGFEPVGPEEPTS